MSPLKTEDLRNQPEIVCAEVCAQKPSIGVDSEFVHALNSPQREFDHPDGCVSGWCRQCGEIVEALEPSRCFYCMAIICYGCWDETGGSCRGCVADIARGRRKIKAELQAMHKLKVGRPKALKDCIFCENRFSSRDIRKHKPLCKKVAKQKTEEPWSDAAS